MNSTLICDQCKRLWVPETKGPCPECGGHLTELIQKFKKPTGREQEIHNLYMTKKMSTFDQEQNPVN